MKKAGLKPLMKAGFSDVESGGLVAFLAPLLLVVSVLVVPAKKAELFDVS